MEQVLLVSGNFIKGISNISDNISGKLIEPAIYQAQNEGLRGILGDALEDKLESLVVSGDINNEENVAYKRLLVKAQYFLAYTAIADLIMLTCVKIDNAGNQQVSDEKMEPLDITESYRLRDFYLHKADFLCRQLQDFILKNRKDYPELSDNDCNSIKSNLHSAATCGIWLGGPRNPMRRNTICRRRYR